MFFIEAEIFILFHSFWASNWKLSSLLKNTQPEKSLNSACLISEMNVEAWIYLCLSERESSESIVRIRLLTHLCLLSILYRLKALLDTFYDSNRREEKGEIFNIFFIFGHVTVQQNRWMGLCYSNLIDWKKIADALIPFSSGFSRSMHRFSIPISMVLSHYFNFFFFLSYNSIQFIYFNWQTNDNDD